ncbi:hypothetical protein U6M47_12795, partial [Cutibacterium acnes]
MMYPLVRDLAADGIPVTVTCRVLNLTRAAYYRWLADPVTARDLHQAYLANALFDAHRDDPEFGHRLLADEAALAGEKACDRTVWRRCSENGWWSVFGRKRARNGKKPGPPAHEDRVQRNFSAETLNELWLTDITDRARAAGELGPGTIPPRVNEAIVALARNEILFVLGAGRPHDSEGLVD